MPLPTPGQVHAVDVPLSMMSQAIIQSEELYGVSRKVFPVVNVDKQTNKYYVWDQKDFFRTDALQRAPGAESAGSGLRLSTDSYSCQVWASHFDIDHQTLANADAGIDLERGAVAKVTRDILIREDIDWAATFFVTGVWNSSAGPINGTWDLTNSTPIEDMRARFYTMAQNTGIPPNKLTLGANTYKRLQDHPDILDRIKYTQRGVVTPDLIAAVLGIENVYVLFGVQNSAVEGAGTGTFAFNAGNHALLSYSPTAASLYAASAGYTFNWTGLYNSSFPLAISQFPIPQRKVLARVEAETAFDNKVVAAVLGELVLSAVAS
jgi:hypothetical protein